MSTELGLSGCQTEHEAHRLPSQAGFGVQAERVVSSSRPEREARRWERCQLTPGPVSTGSTVCLGSSHARGLRACFEFSSARQF